MYSQLMKLNLPHDAFIHRLLACNQPIEEKDSREIFSNAMAKYNVE